MYSNGFYSGWGWVFWIGFMLLMFSGFGNWGYTYRAHRRLEDIYPKKGAIDILNERYARGEIKYEEYVRMKSHIVDRSDEGVKKIA